MSHDNFAFNGISNFQITECGMGSKPAPCYSNMFMGSFEETYLLIHRKKLYRRHMRVSFMI